MFRPRNPFVLLLALTLVFGGSFWPRMSARADEASPIRIIEQTVENHFPDALRFRLTAEADSTITKVTLFYRLLGEISTTRAVPDFEPGPRVEVDYTWDTHQLTIPPSAPVEYYWVLEDEQGHQLRTEAQTIRYDDVRFSWQERADEQLVVRWYQGDADFGELIYRTARQALDQMEAQTGYRLETPVYVLLYANKQDFSSWHTYVDTWVGGQAFPALGVTVEIIPPDSAPSWIRAVIPHEIAHLFFYQAIHANLADWPHWLDEGFAQFYEFASPDERLRLAAQAAQQGTLIPLQALNGSFGRDAEKVRLAYAESLSAVVFIHETWGDTGFQQLVAAFRQGRTVRQAIQEALGVSWEEFVAQWVTWMGVPATPAPSPKPTQGYVFPTPYAWGTPSHQASATSEGGAEETSTPAKKTALPLRCLAPLGGLLVPLALALVISRGRRRAR